MSANNYADCPRCIANAKVEQERLAKLAEEQYGKVSPSEYKKLLSESENMEYPNETLREDWEIKTDRDGEFSVYYGCTCEHCGFSREFKHVGKWEL